jgi:hypothetical protein
MPAPDLMTNCRRPDGHGDRETAEVSEWRNLAPGESLAIPPGTVHTLANRFRRDHSLPRRLSPALDLQEYIEHADRLTRAGKLIARMTEHAL